MSGRATFGMRSGHWMRTACAILANRIMELAAGTKLRDSRNTRTQIFPASVVAE